METESTERQAYDATVEPLGEPTIILFTDMVSYSRRVEQDELGTLDFMSSCFDTLRVLARRYGGKVIKTLGDGALLVFWEANSAVRLGVEFHRIVAKIQTGISDPNHFRVGIHAGHVVERKGDIFGSVVNVAARLQKEAPPGSCIISETVHKEMDPSCDLTFEAAGSPRLKNIDRRIPIFRVIDPEARQSQEQTLTRATLSVTGQTGFLKSNGELLAPAEKSCCALLGYLALCPGHSETSGRLASLLWSEKEAGSALAELDAHLDQLNQLKPSGMKEIIYCKGEHVVLDPMGFDTNLDEWEHAVRIGRVPEQLQNDFHWPQHILADADGLNAHFDGWLKIQRAVWKRRLLQGLEQLIEVTQFEDEAVGHAADAILLLEPGNEIASYGRICNRIENNNKSGAFEEFTRLQSYLSETYGAAPGPRIKEEIQAAIQGVKKSAEKDLSLETARRRRMLRILVHKFVAYDEESKHQIHAFRTDLVANLARFREWSVIDGLPDQEKVNTRRIDYSIEGEIRNVPSNGISIAVTKTENQQLVWSEVFAVETANWNETQQDVIRQIAAAIERYISTDRLTAMIGGAQEPTSHDAWLRGDRAMMRWTPESAAEARKIFLQLLEDDPNYAPAMTSLASMSNISHILWPGTLRDAEKAREADALASRAVEIDPMDSRNQRAVAWAAALNGSFSRASMHLDLAMKLNPNYPVTLASCAMGYAWFGEPDKAEAAMVRLFSITDVLPDWIWSYLCSAWFFLDRLDKARDAAEMAGDSIVDTQGWLAAILARLGDIEGAHVAAKRFEDRVSAEWAGDATATPEAVRDWFLTAFPIRDAVDRGKLSASLNTAMTL